MCYFPAFLNLKQKKCLVVGGGKVSYRKTKSLIECGAFIDVISEKFDDKILSMARKEKNINLIIRGVEREDFAKGYFLAVFTTDDKSLNECLAIYAKENSILVNVVDNPKISDFIFPSIIKRGSFTISISTSGKSPALCTKIRKKLEKEFDESYGRYVNFLGWVRDYIIERVKDKNKRKVFFLMVAEDDFFQYFNKEGNEKSKLRVIKMVGKTND